MILNTLFPSGMNAPDLLEITYLERDHQSNMYIEKFTLPVFNKEDWEEFKNAGDAAFILMEKSHV